MFKFVSSNIKYPAIAKENNIQGKVYVNFIVDTGGFVTPRFVANNLVFPYTTRKGGLVMRAEYMWKVPMDDTTTYHVHYLGYVIPPSVKVETQPLVPWFDIPLKDERGRWILDHVMGQDAQAWCSQGEICDRSVEHLAPTDAGVLAYRRLLRDQLAVVQKGGTPMNVFRDPEKNKCIELDAPLWALTPGGPESTQGYDVDHQERYSPVIGEVIELLRRAEHLRMAAYDPSKLLYSPPEP